MAIKLHFQLHLITIGSFILLTEWDDNLDAAVKKYRKLLLKTATLVMLSDIEQKRQSKLKIENK